MDWEAREAKRAARIARMQARRQARWARRQSAPPIAGVLIMAVGVLFLLGNLGIINVREVWQFWPLILIALGIAKMVPLASFGQTLWGGILAMVGGVFLLHNLDIVQGNVWQFIWPILLIGFGAGMLANRMDWGFPNISASEAAESSVRGSTADTFHAEQIFGHTKRKIDSQDFRGGKVEVVFGGATIDLREADTKLEEVVVKADAVFGGIELFVPDTWETVVRGTAVFGAFEDKTHPVPHGGDRNPPRLVVKGGAVFGGVLIKN
jgi:predicted membrane protein